MRTLKKTLGIVGWVLVGIVGLVALLPLAIQTPFAKKQIVKIAENIVNPMFNAQLSVGELTGNFFTHLELKDVLLIENESDTIAFIPEIGLEYQLLPLLQGKIVVRKAAIEAPFIRLYQTADSSWNVQHLMKPSDEEPDTTASSFNMAIVAQKVLLNNGKIHINAFDSIIPQAVNDLYIDLSARYAASDIEAQLNDFRFTTRRPDLALNRLALHAAMDDKTAELKSFSLQTAQNQISATALYHFDLKEESYLNLETTPIILNEFAAFLPEGFQLQARPTLALNAAMEDKRLSVGLDLKEDAQGVELQLLSFYLMDFLSDSTAPVNYDLALDIDRVNLQYWLADSAMNYLIDGSLKVKGEGLNPELLNAQLQGNFDDIVASGYPIEKLEILLDYAAGDAAGIIESSGNFGFFSIEPNVKQLFSARPAYAVGLRAQRLNIAPILQNPEMNTDLNLNLFVDGAGLELEKIAAEARLELMKSEALGYAIDTVGAKIRFANQNAVIDTLLIKALSAFVQVSGNYNLQGTSDLLLKAALPDARKIAAAVGLEDDLEVDAALEAHLTGTPEDLNADAQIFLNATRFQDFLLDSATIRASGNIKNNKILAQADILANRFSTGDFLLDSIHLEADTDMENVRLKLALGNEDLNAQLKSLVRLGDVISISLSDLMIGYQDYRWKMMSDTARIAIAPDAYEVRDFHLSSPAGQDSVQSISADGVVRLNGEQDFNLNISHFDVAKALHLFAPEQAVTGLLNVDVRLSGAAASPTLDGKLNIDGLAYQDFHFDLFDAAIGLKEKKLNATLNVVPQDSGTLRLTAEIPANIRLDSMSFDVKPKPSDPLSLQLLIEKLPISIANIFLEADKMEGFLESDIKIGGTFGKPDMDGAVFLQNGAVEMDKYGVKYHDMTAALNFKNDRVSIDTFFIGSRQGNFQIKGDAVFQSEIYNAALKKSDIAITFQNFNPVDHKYYNMEMSGGVDLAANADSATFSGEIDIAQAMVYLPAVMALMGRSVVEVDKPLLVKELEKNSAGEDSIVFRILPDTSSTAKENKLAFLNNLQGTLNLKIPRNTWIRNDDMRFELSGDVELVKHRDFFELFGTVDVVRGQLSLLGKVFVIQTGIITFQGGEELNPLLNVEALYTFRDKDRNRRDLVAAIGGDLSDPKISFTYEGTPISEGDALSYILFGTNLDDLGTDQQEGLNAADLATTLAASLISSQLTKFLGNAFSVDYVELKSDGFDNATFVVGKYITNKMFVSYEQTVGHIEDDDVARYEMTLEYELFKFLFLQLTSSSISNGADVIFKFNSK